MLEEPSTRTPARPLTVAPAPPAPTAVTWRPRWRLNPLGQLAQRVCTNRRYLEAAVATGRHDWLSRIDKDNKEQRDCEIRRLWFACQTEEEIAKALGMSRVRFTM